MLAAGTEGLRLNRQMNGTVKTGSESGLKDMDCRRIPFLRKICISKNDISKTCISKTYISKTCISKTYISKIYISKICISKNLYLGRDQIFEPI